MNNFCYRLQEFKLRNQNFAMQMPKVPRYLLLLLVLTNIFFIIKQT